METPGNCIESSGFKESLSDLPLASVGNRICVQPDATSTEVKTQGIRTYCTAQGSQLSVMTWMG